MKIEFTVEYGNITKQSVGAIQRKLLQLEDEGGDLFFGEPMMDMKDMVSMEGDKGVISVLHCEKLYQKPLLYSTFLLWMLSELFENLPEVGDCDKPKMIFFFDEAHMLFKDTSKALTDKIEQIVRLIRSKGVGVYFISQSPSDLPESILGQCGNRVQHALRAFTPKDQAAVKAAAKTFRPNPAFETEREILELGTGEALVSFLDEEGAPAMVQRAKILFPLSQIGAITDEQRAQIIQNSRICGKYEDVKERESAFEIIAKQRENAEKQAQEAKEKAEKEKEKARLEKEKEKEEAKKKKKSGKSKSVLTTVLGTAVTYFAKTIATQLARNLTKKKK